MADVPTSESGYFEVTVPGAQVLSVTANPFVAEPQDYVEMEDGSRISKYFQLTKTVVVDKDNMEVDFVLPSAAALLLDAYSPEGEKMLMGEFNAQVSPDWYQQVYGVFPVGITSIPTSASVGQLSGAWHIDKEYNQWQPYFAIPADESVYLTMLWRVPSIGTIWLRADNSGEGYSLQSGEVQRKNLVYEFAKTEYLKAMQLNEAYESQGHSFSSAVYDQLDSASGSLSEADSETDDSGRALCSYRVLELAIGAKERMTMEVAERGIAERKKTISIVIETSKGEPVSGANVTYNQTSLEFVKGYGIAALSEPPEPSTKAGKEMGFEYLYKGDLSWSEVETQRGVYDFSSIDSYLEGANSLGYEVVVGMLWLGGGSDGVNEWENVPDWAKNLEFQEFKQELYQFACKTAAHLAQKVRYLLPAVEPGLFTRTGSRYVSADFAASYTCAVDVEELVELIEAVFRGARDAGGGSLLGYSMNPCYNSYHINPTPFGSAPAPYWLLKLALDSGVEPDFIGVEGHYGVLQAPIDLSTLSAIIHDVHVTSDLPILLTELSSYPSRTEDYNIESDVYWHNGMTQETQAEWNTGVFKIAMGLPYVLGVQMVHLIPDNPSGWGAALYGGTFIGTDFLSQDSKRKQVYYEMKALFDSWNIQGYAVTDEQGKFNFTGFGGDYELAITMRDGCNFTTQVHILSEGHESYSVVANFEEEPSESSNGGCFIATATYRTPMAHEIQILREFRDEYLLTNPPGRTLVDLYYQISPPIADFITEHPSLKPIVRAGLMPVVAMCSIVLDSVPQFTSNDA